MLFVFIILSPCEFNPGHAGLRFFRAMKKYIILSLALIVSACSDTPTNPGGGIIESREVEFEWLSNDTLEIPAKQTGVHKFKAKCARSDNSRSEYTLSYDNPLKGMKHFSETSFDTIWTITLSPGFAPDTGLFPIKYSISRSECDRLEVTGYIHVILN